MLHPGGQKYNLTCHVLDDLTGELSTTRLPKTFLDKFAGFTLAVPSFHTASRVDIIGMAHYHDFVIWLLHTAMGRAVTGKPAKTRCRQETPSVLLNNVITLGEATPNHVGIYHDHEAYSPTPAVNNGLFEFQRFWEIEELPSSGRALPLSAKQTLGVAHYDRTSTRDSGGRVRVSMPFREQAPLLGNSRQQALKRFLSLESRLYKDHGFSKNRELIKEFMDKGHLELVPPDDPHPIMGEFYNLPHHGVPKEPSTTPKLRVVFDGSATPPTGVSLNDTFLTGLLIGQLADCAKSSERPASSALTFHLETPSVLGAGAFQFVSRMTRVIDVRLSLVTIPCDSSSSSSGQLHYRSGDAQRPQVRHLCRRFPPRR